MKLLFICLIAALLIGSVTAAPVTGAAAGVTSNAATLSMAAPIVDPCWFEWGQLSGSLSWKTPNRTATTSFTIKGSPLNGNTKFYYRACDSTGCGLESSFTTLSVTPMPTTTYSYIFDNLTESGFDVQYLAQNSIEPYMWPFDNATLRLVVFGLLYFAIFTGLWLTGRGMGVPVLVGFITASFILVTGAGLYMGIPAEWQSVSMGIAYAGLAGLAVYLLKK